jgi:hypothetical protein
MGHCRELDFFYRYQTFKIYVVKALVIAVHIHTLFSITVPLKDVASF